MEMSEKINALLSEHAELKRKFQERAQTMFKEVTGEMFEKNPGVQAIIWAQFTPYFNDGETCEFGVRDPVFTNSPKGEDVSGWGEYEGEDDGIWACEDVGYVLTSGRDWHANDAEIIMKSGGVDANSCKAFSEMLTSSEMSDVFLSMFGDHAKVTATRGGFDVDDFEHD